MRLGSCIRGKATPQPSPSPPTLAREFVYGRDFLEPVTMIDWTAAGQKPAGVAEILHYLQDALGSIVALTNPGAQEVFPASPGRVVERYTYDPYGRTLIEKCNQSTGLPVERLAASRFGNPFAWTGQRYDAGVKLYHFWCRSYSPRLGRWLQRDPLGYVDGVSLYEYVASQPTFWIDPLGLVETPPPPGPPPVPVPGYPDAKWRWNPDARNDRGGTWGPDPRPRGVPGGHPTGSWDSEGEGHWDIDDGNENRSRYDKDGNPLTEDEAHGRVPRPKRPGSPAPNPQPPEDPAPSPEPSPGPSARSGGSDLWPLVGLVIVAGVLVAADVVLGGPTGEGIGPACLLVGGCASEEGGESEPCDDGATQDDGNRQIEGAAHH